MFSQYGFSGSVSIQKTGLAFVFFLSSSNRNHGKTFAVLSKKRHVQSRNKLYLHAGASSTFFPCSVNNAHDHESTPGLSPKRKRGSILSLSLQDSCVL